MAGLSLKGMGPRLKVGAKIGALTGLGFVFGKYGADIAKSVSPAAATFAGKGKAQEAGLRLGIGLVLSLGLGMLLGRKSKATAAKLTAYLMGGVVLAAGAPLAIDTVEKAAAKVKELLSKNGASAGAAVQAALPQAAVTNVRQLQTGTRAGGLYGGRAADVTSRIRRPGGILPPVLDLARTRAL